MIKQGQRGEVANTGGKAMKAGRGDVPRKGTPYWVNENRCVSPLGIPCQKPPVGCLSAINLKAQKIVWQVTVGTVQDTGPLG